MKFKLPALHNVVRKSNSSSKEDIKQYVFIHNGIAFTFDNPIFIVNLREYVKNECSIEDEQELEELERILGFLNHKAIPVAAWKELTSECDVVLSDNEDEIIIEKVSHKMILDLEINNIGLPYFKKEIQKYIKILQANTYERDSTSFDGNILGLMGSVFKKEIKGHTIILLNVVNSAAVKYLVNGKPYIVGIMNINEDVNQLNKTLTIEMDLQDLVFEINGGMEISQEDYKKEELKEVPAPFELGDSFDEGLPQF